MGMNPGSPGFAIPPAEDDQVRKQRDTERDVRENATLSGTVNYLSSLRTLVAADANVAWTTFTSAYTTGTASITVTTTEPMLARVTYTAQVFVHARSGTTGASSSTYWGAVALNGLQQSGAVPVGIESYPAGTTPTTVTSEFAFMCDRIVSVPPGLNSFTHQYRGQAIVGSGSGGYSEGDRANGILVVQFIGRP